MKIYEYRGVLVRVPEKTKYIAVDADGVIKGYEEQPDINFDGSLDSSHAAQLSVLNAGKSLVDISMLPVFAPLVLNETASPGTNPYKIGDKYVIQSPVNEEKCLNSEVHIVVSCYAPGAIPWVQVLHVHVNGLTIDNKLLANVVGILHELQVN